MTKYSHFRLSIVCDEAGLQEVQEHLDVPMSNELVDAGLDPEIHDPSAVPFPYHWRLNSPLGAESGSPARFEALVDAIEPFGDRLATLDERFSRLIHILYHNTPQHPHGILGEFDMFCTPAKLMPQLAAWNVSVWYETMWFDHPDWESPRTGWWKRLTNRWR